MTRNPQDDLQPDGQPGRALRRGWTTGACAAAAAKAAYVGLLTGRFPDPVQITLPKGEQPSFSLVETRRCDQAARASIEKDAGDDPDVTHGAIITVKVCRGEPGSGLIFIAGEGVGVVTLPGLPVAVGEPAINPGPRKLICSMVAEIAHSYGDSGDLEMTVSIPGGESMAKRTANERLGIVGGLSILGTTGIVIPYSCSAWIASIHRGID
ncbi:MAG: cobalt-precorrin-5B (C(1))-methyltransferase CbiD, partial [Geminicoccaceae bacterium]